MQLFRPVGSVSVNAPSLFIYGHFKVMECFSGRPEIHISTVVGLSYCRNRHIQLENSTFKTMDCFCTILL